MSLFLLFAKHTTPKPSYDVAACRKHALFFSSIPHHYGLAIILMIAIPFISVYLTRWMQRITPGAKEDDAPEAQPASVPTSDSHIDVETTAIPDTHPPSLDEEQPPPPYVPEPPITATTTPTVVIATPPSKPEPKRSSAHLFVLGTILLLTNAILLFIDALGTQTLIFCIHKGLPKEWWNDFGKVYLLSFLWLAVAIPTFWATIALICWLMLLRDLWGPSTRKKYQMKPKFLLQATGILLITPFLLLYFINEGLKRYGPIGIGWMAKAVEVCQRKCCAGALEEDGEELRDVELEEGRGAHDEHADAGQSSTAGYEENAGLIEGMDK